MSRETPSRYKCWKILSSHNQRLSVHGFCKSVDRIERQKSCALSSEAQRESQGSCKCLPAVPHLNVKYYSRDQSACGKRSPQPFQTAGRLPLLEQGWAHGQRIKVGDEKHKAGVKRDPSPMGEQLSLETCTSLSIPLLHCDPPLQPFCKERRPGFMFFQALLPYYKLF